MNKIILGTCTFLLMACDPVNNLDKPVASQGPIAQANVECIERDGILVGRRGGGVICKLPNGKIVDQMTFL